MAKYQKEFEVTLEDKPYQMIAFLSRSYHESVKSEGAFVEKSLLLEARQSTTLHSFITVDLKELTKGLGQKEFCLTFIFQR